MEFDGEIKEGMITKWRITFLFSVTCELSVMLIVNFVTEDEHVLINVPIRSHELF